MHDLTSRRVCNLPWRQYLLLVARGDIGLLVYTGLSDADRQQCLLRVLVVGIGDACGLTDADQHVCFFWVLVVGIGAKDSSFNEFEPCQPVL